MSGKLSRAKARLNVEQLEARTMLSGDGISPSNPLGGADFVNFAAAAANLANQMAAQQQNVQPLVSTPVAGPGTPTPVAPSSMSFDAASGVGQMLITTGANTLGISSFATPIAGFGSVNAGKSGA